MWTKNIETRTRSFTSFQISFLSIQVLFLDIAMPTGKSRKELIKRYDDNLGFPTEDMVKQMKESVKKITDMKTFSDWYKVSLMLMITATTMIVRKRVI